MRCPKCGYVSFDHNESCPKCNRNLSQERERLNLISFSPEPPFLLAGLLGDVNESGMHYHPAGSGAFKTLDEEIEFEAGTEELTLTPGTQEDETEIEIELDSLAEEEISAPQHEYLDTAEAETLTPDDALEHEEMPATQASDLDTLSGLELEVPGAPGEEIESEITGEGPEPLVFEMEDITLEDKPTTEELDLEFGEDEISEAPTEVHGTAVEDQELVLEEPEEAIGKAEAEPTISLEDLKDDELGEVDVSIDELSEPTQKIADGHGG